MAISDSPKKIESKGTKDAEVQVDILARKIQAHKMDSIRMRPGTSEQYSSASNLENKFIHWFRWDTTEVYKLDPEKKQWNLRNEVKLAQKFLFFSSICQLQGDQGCFILGGSDNEDNYSK